MDVADIPTRTTGRLTAAFQVIICCGQLPTQTAIAAALLAFGVPADVVRKLNADIDRVLRTPEALTRWTELGITPLGGSPEEAARKNAAEAERWTRVIKAAGIRAE